MGEKIFHFKLSLISRHPSDGQKALTKSFKISGSGWESLATTNKEILALGLSFSLGNKYARTLKIQWPPFEILMIKESCNLTGLDHFGDATWSLSYRDVTHSTPQII